MNEDILKMAREAGFQIHKDGEIGIGDGWHIQTDIVERFYNLVRAAEQDRCCRIIYGMAGSDNVAQRTVEKIRNTQHNDENPSF